MAGQRTQRVSRRTAVVAVALSVVLGTTAATVASSPDPAAAATTFVVDSEADAIDAVRGDGVCATSAGSCTLRAAIHEANTLSGPDVIELPAGRYVLTGVSEDGDDSGDLDITSAMWIVGAGAAATIIDGNASDRVIHVLETAGDVTISGVTISGGLTAEDGGGIYNVSTGTLTLEAVAVTANVARNGGGMFNAGALGSSALPSETVITSSTFAGNTAIAGGGGGIWSDHEGALTLVDVDVSGNFADDHGGGLAVVSKASLTMTGSIVRGNIAHSDGGGASTATEGAVRFSGVTFSGNEAGVAIVGELGGGNGGALSSSGGPLEIVDSEFSGNYAPDEGGAVYLDNGGSVGITDTVVRDNRAGAGGGGIENAAMQVTLARLLVTGNQAALDGGGIESQGSGALTIIDTTVSGNTAENGGGFANAADSNTHVERSLFWGNQAIANNDEAGLGGGIYSLGDADATYENITITGNSAATRWGGFYVDANAGVRVTSSTIVGNTAPAGSGVGGAIGSVNFPIEPSTSVIFRNTIVAGNLPVPNCTFAIGSEGGNLQGDDSCYFIGPNDRTSSDPGLEPLADNGGPTMTMAIRPDGPAFGGGVGPCPPTDQRGVTRRQSAPCDSGAFEVDGDVVVPPTTTVVPTSTVVPPPPPVQCGPAVTYSAAADAWIDQGSASDNKGDDSTLKVMSKVGANLRGLVHFAMPAGAPAGCIVESATLNLFAASSAGGRTLQALQVAGPWVEGAVTWANQPATTGVVASTSSGSGYRQWDVTAQVQAMLASGANHGFLIRDAAEGQDAEQQFHSREKGEWPPQLIVTYVAAPVPTTTTEAPTTTTEVPTTTTEVPRRRPRLRRRRLRLRRRRRPKCQPRRRLRFRRRRRRCRRRRPRFRRRRPRCRRRRPRFRRRRPRFRRRRPRRRRRRPRLRRRRPRLRRRRPRSDDDDRGADDDD